MRRPAFTLLEVIIALAILTGALAVLGELLRNGLSSAQRARELSRATLICEGKLAQIGAGILAPEPVSSAVVEDEYSGDWLYSVEVEETALPALLAVRVTVQRNQPAEKHPIACSLVRWVPDPSAETAASSSADSSSTSSSSSSSSTGSSSQGKAQ